jgi:damage-control phosphatase, subfamily I
VLNDATPADARFVGLEERVQVKGNGSDAPGTVLGEVCPEVREDFARADVILSKGQGNFETLDDAPGNLYFLFKVKCKVAARMTRTEEGSYLLARLGRSPHVLEGGTP